MSIEFFKYNVVESVDLNDFDLKKLPLNYFLLDIDDTNLNWLKKNKIDLSYIQNNQILLKIEIISFYRNPFNSEFSFNQHEQFKEKSEFLLYDFSLFSQLKQYLNNPRLVYERFIKNWEDTHILSVSLD